VADVQHLDDIAAHAIENLVGISPHQHRAHARAIDHAGALCGWRANRPIARSMRSAIAAATGGAATAR
jgi:hypothetical protein